MGGVLTGLLAVACGWMGENHHIGFTVSSRFSWGMRGSYFPVVLRVFVACMWFGSKSHARSDLGGTYALELRHSWNKSC